MKSKTTEERSGRFLQPHEHREISTPDTLMNTQQTKQVATKRRRRRTRRLQHTEVTLNGHRLWLKRTRARLLSALLTRKDHAASDASLLPLLPKGKRNRGKLYKRMWRLNQVIEPTGLKIIRLCGYGFILYEQKSDKQKAHEEVLSGLPCAQVLQGVEVIETGELL